ncbi:hypothetical protein LSH36_171g02033 [Paralvinella palmiformis]|uniref:PA domain-containing protein n=1 Tax=Paralvinella palmiformis TaxID=53620 RepID=A0AAD9JSK0_9ANNE|nr:hypothetical protein LSH36_171g02033 [Paralvinella palmiformis]
MDVALAGRESNFNASDDNSCDTDSDDIIHFHHTIGFVLASVASCPSAIGRVISSVWRRHSSDLHLKTRHVAWNDNWFFEVTHPDPISYMYRIRPAKNFGTRMSHSFIDIELVPVEPFHACSPIDNGIFINNNIALVLRGECSFVTKALHVEEVGGNAIIIMDHDKDNDSLFVDMISDGTNRNIQIPSFYMLGKDGYMITKTLKERNLKSAVIKIPINGTGVAPHLLHQPPWTLW